MHVCTFYMYIMQENLNLKIGQAQLEGEVQRLRGELQRRETAIHRVEAQSTSQARELSAALEELSLLRGRLHGERKEEEEESSESGVEGELCDPPQEESTNDMVCLTYTHVPLYLLTCLWRSLPLYHAHFAWPSHIVRSVSSN